MSQASGTQGIIRSVRFYELRLPPAWREVTVDEARQYRATMPKDLVLPHPGIVDYLGPVDAWAKNGFDGRLLTVTVVDDAEHALDDTTIAQTRERVLQSNKERGYGVELLHVKKTTLGEASHPALECAYLLDSGPGRQRSHLLSYMVPTGGNTLLFTFRAYETDFRTVAPLVANVCSSMRFAHPPEGPHELSDQLVQAAVIGGLVGAGLLLLRWLAHKLPAS